MAVRRAGYLGLVAVGVVGVLLIPWWAHGAPASRVLPDAEADTRASRPAAHDRPELDEERTASRLAASTGASPQAFLCGSLFDADRDQPLADAELALDPAGGRDPGVETRGRTGPDGTFRLPLAGGRSARDYVLSSPGYARVTVRPAEASRWPDAIDLGERRLWRVATLRGRVLRPDGNTPCAGARLFVGTRPRELPASDAHGWFDSRDLVAGRELAADTPLAALADEGCAWIALTGSTGRQRIDDLRIVLHDHGVATVQVMDEADTPLPGVRVEAQDDERHVWGAASRSAETDAQGRASLRLPLWEQELFDSPWDGTWSFRAVVPSGFLCTEARGVTLSQERPATVILTRKRARTCVVQGVVASRRGGSVAAARILSAGDARVPLAVANGNGWYQIAAMPVPVRDEITVAVQAAGFRSATRTVPVRRDATGIALDLELEPVVPIAGFVVDQDGRGLAGVVVKLSQPGDPNGAEAEETRTGPDGRFEFVEPGPGDSVVTVEHCPAPRWVRPPPWHVFQGMKEPRIEVTVLPAAQGTLRAVVVAADTRREILPTEATLTDLRGIERQTVVQKGMVTAAGLWTGPWRLTVRAAGRAEAVRDFEVPEPGRPVEVHVELGAPGVLTGRLDLDGVPGDQLRDFYLLLLSPPTGIPVWAPGSVGTRNGLAVAARDLSFRVEDVMPGQTLELTLDAPRPHLLWAAARVLVPYGETVDVVVRATAAGRVVLRGSEPLPRGALEVVTTGPTAWRPTRVIPHDTAGRPLQAELVWPPGPCRWQLRFVQEFGAAVLRGEVAFEVRAGAEREVGLVLR